MPNKGLCLVQDEGIQRGSLKNPRIQQLRIFSRLQRTITLKTPERNKKIRALFDTGSNVFILSQERAQIHNLFVMERGKPISLLGFSGQQETAFGKYFAPLINLRIEDHVSQVSCEIGPQEKGVDLIIPGG
jgi:hypothetical protein